MAITAAMNEWGLVGYETLAARGKSATIDNLNNDVAWW